MKSNQVRAGELNIKYDTLPMTDIRSVKTDDDVLVCLLCL